MNTQRAYNKKMEKTALLGTPKQKRKKYKAIIESMGCRNITLNDIANGLGEKEKGFLDMVDEQGMTMDEIVVLQQYANAIIDRSTKAAEFIRDSVGEAPKNIVEVQDNQSGLSKMSTEELLELRDLLKQQQSEE